MKLGIKIIKTKKCHRSIVRNMLKEMSDCLCKMGKRPPMRIRANKYSYVVIIDGAIIGTVSLSKEMNGYRAFYRFFIKEKYRGTGVGKLIMSKVEEMIGDNTSLYLNVYIPNVGARKLYEKMGYEEYDRNEKYIWMKKERNNER